MHVRHELLAGDFARRLSFSGWFNERCRRENFLNNLLIGDVFNTQNVCQYAPKGHPSAFNFERGNSRVQLTV